MSTETSAKISLQDVRKSFGQRQVLNGINLEINQSEVIAFIGSSGSGKSTLLRLIIGSMRPDEGEIRVFGKNVCTMNRRERGSPWRRKSLADSSILGSFPSTV